MEAIWSLQFSFVYIGQGRCGKVWKLTARASAPSHTLPPGDHGANLNALNWYFAPWVVITLTPGTFNKTRALCAPTRTHDAGSSINWKGSRMTVPALVDTISAYVAPSHRLDDALFDGGAIQQQFSQKQVSARLWANPAQGSYAPRATYWRGHGLAPNGAGLGEAELTEEAQGGDYPYGLFKLEFSIPKLVPDHNKLGNPTHDQALDVLRSVDEYAHQFAPDFPPITQWICQRVDYSYNFNVDPNLRAYMSVLNNLRITGMSRHPFDATEGVVWKGSGRWVKFYNKGLEMGLLDEQVLRFEVSNYKAAVRYMAKEQFGCERTVIEMIQPGRALYTMAIQWERLGLSEHGYGTRELLDQRLRDYFGSSVAGAAHVLDLHRRYGSACYKDGIALISRNNYNTWLRKLRKGGFLTQVDDEDDIIIERALAPLHLPTDDVFSYYGENLNVVRGEFSALDQKILWEKFSAALGLDNPAVSTYLMGRFKQMEVA